MDHIGIDVHKIHSQICILSEDGELIERRMRSEPARFAEELGPRQPERILIESATVHMKKLPPQTAYYFNQFASESDWNWHPSDMRKFRAFIHAAHHGRTKLSAPQLKDLLLARGFDDEDASDLAERYQFGRELLTE